MARISDDLHAGGPAADAGHKIILQASGGTVKVPSDAFIAHADIARDGQDLVLHTADGHAAVIKGYFGTEPQPVIQSPSGTVLTPALVHSFAHHDGLVQYADNATASDASPVGAVREVHGHATVRHPDGTSETIIVGTAIHEGDVVETDGAGAVNITFRDNSSFAVSHSAKLAIDEYVFDPHSDAGASNFSMLRGVFVYTSGLIGHQDPDDVHIHTPAGSIGIRGTVIAGNVDNGQITVVEGAIVLQSNSGEETTLSNQYETAQLNAQSGHITSEGTLSAGDVSSQYSSLSTVAPSFFSGLGSSTNTTPDTHSTTPTTPDNSHGSQATPDTTTTTAAIGNEGTAFSTDTVFTASGSTATAGAATTASSSSTTTTGAAAPAADTSTSTGTSSIGGDTIVGAINGTTVTQGSGTTTGTVGTNPVDTAPVVTATTASMAENAGPTVINVLANASDPDGDPLTVASITSPSVAGFTLSGGNVVFDPSVAFASLIIGETATASVGYTISDGRGGLGIATATVTVTGVAPLDIVANLSGHGFSITDNVNEGFGSSIAVATNFSGGQDGLLLVKNSNDSTPGGLFFELSGGSSPGNILANSLTSFQSGLMPNAGGDHNMVVASIGDFGTTNTPYFIIGAPVDNSYPSVASSGNITIVDANGNVLETVSGLGSFGLAHFGQAVAGIGDINGDGYADVLIGAPDGTTGNAFVLFGGNINAHIDVSTLSGTTGLILAGAGVENLGADVSGAGDFNNDGYADFMLSSPGTGIIDVYIQGTNTGTPLTINVGSTSNTDIPIMNLGDVNGGGVSDIGVLVHSANGGRGELAVYYGGSGFSPGDNEGLGNAHFTVAPTTGTLAAAGAVGDFNGDGKSDIGVIITNGNTADIYIVYGGTLPTTADNTWLNNPTNAFHMVYNAPTTADLTGMTIGSAGDLNGDGLGDIVIGMPGVDTSATPDGTADGVAIIIYGEASGSGVVTDNSTLDMSPTAGIVTAGANNESLVATASGATLNDSGYTGTSFSGGGGGDTFQLSSLPKHVSGGNGNDEIQIIGAGTSLDFSTLGSDAVSGIEKITMEQSNQSLTLSLGNILQLLSETSTGNLEIVAANSASGTTLTINGQGHTSGTTSTDTGGSHANFDSDLNSVKLVSDYTTDKTETDGSHTFNVYDLGANEHLLVDVNIAKLHVA